MRFKGVLEPSDEGGFAVYVPSLPRCISVSPGATFGSRLGAIGAKPVGLIYKTVKLRGAKGEREVKDAIIGADFFQIWKIKLDPERETLILDPNALKLKLV